MGISGSKVGGTTASGKPTSTSASRKKDLTTPVMSSSNQPGRLKKVNSNTKPSVSAASKGQQVKEHKEKTAAVKI